MAIRDLVLYTNDILTKKCAPVEDVDSDVKQLVNDMIETMYDAPGIGLAAPQVGVNKRITVVDVGAREEGSGLVVLINPEIIHSEGSIVWEEGCLSIPGIYEKVKRASKIKVRALDKDGNPFELEATELFAVAIQHEIDHLDGVLFLDHLSHLKRKMALKKYRKLLERAEASSEDGEEEAQI